MTASTDNLWVSQTSRMQAFARACAGMAIGSTMMWMTRDLAGPGLSTERAAFALGMVVALAGVAGLLAGQETTTVDTRARTITIERRSLGGLLGAKQRVLRFDQIAKLTAETLGDSEGGTPRHYLSAKLKSGDEVSLFLGQYAETDSADDARETLSRLAKLLAKD